MSKELVFRMTEEYYLSIPDEFRATYMRTKIVSEEVSDWEENMNDPLFAELSQKAKIAKEKLRERQFELREKRRQW